MPARIKSNQDEDRLLRSMAGAIVLGAGFLVYLFTTSPTVYVGDSGEFIASAFCLGNPHNSGYPLYAMVGKIFSMIPLGNVAFRLNLMSASFGALTVWATFQIIVRLKGSLACASCAALLLAFSSGLWLQAACAEVYTFHAFFVAVLILLAVRWDETGGLAGILLFSFVVGLSFANHMQTIMLAPAMFALVFLSNRRILANVRNLLLLAFFLVLGLSVYLYLPVRTDAGAAIHWGDPDTLGRFIDHVSASAHRQGYVLTTSWGGYVERLLGALKEMTTQYYLFLIFAIIGWAQEKEIRHKIFWLLIIIFDTIYTVFLNAISLEITAFQIPSSIVLAVLIGKGLKYVVECNFTGPSIIRMSGRYLKPVLVCLPVVLLSANLYQSDQHANYTAYEYGTNILRSVPSGGTLILGGDNIVFPISYLRLAEGARPDMAIYDRYNLIFKMPFIYKGGARFVGKWEDLRRNIETELIKSGRDVYFALFNEKAFPVADFSLIPHGVTYRAVPSDRFDSALKEASNPWSYYVWQSVNDSFYRDYMNRAVTGYFFMKMGRGLIFMGDRSLGVQMVKTASSVAYNDNNMHLDLAALYTDMVMYEDALLELNLADDYATDRASLHNNWGYYYSKTGMVQEAILAFRKAIDMDPKQPGPYNNVGLMYLEAGRIDEAREAFKKSLAIDADQPALVSFMNAKGL